MTVCAGLRFGPFMGPRSPRTPKKKTGEHRKISEDGDANLQNIRDLTPECFWPLRYARECV